MPFHEKYRKDKNGSVIKDENNNPIVDLEGVDYNKFPKNFLADTKEEADKLYSKYLPTLKFLADKYSRLTGLGSEDFVQEGVIGLARASRDFVSKRSNDFNTFAIYKIKDSMREFVSSQAATIKIPQYIKDAIGLSGKLKRLISTVESIEHASLSDIWDISKKYEKSGEIVKDVTDIRKSISNLAERSCTTVNDLLERSELSPKAPVEIIDMNISNISSDNNTFLPLYESNTLALIKKTLNEREFEIFRLHFIENYTIREIQKILSKTDGTIAVQIRQIREKLNRHKNELFSNVQEYITEEDLPQINPENDILDAIDVEQLKDIISKKDYDLLTAYYIEGKTLKEMEEEAGLKAPTIFIRIRRTIKKLRKDVILNNADHKNIKKAREGDGS